LSEARFDDAVRTLRIGLTLARHIGEGPTLIDDLVAVAVASVMLGHVEELAATPGAPNLYWPLTVLPRPLFDARRPAEYERGIRSRSSPALRRLNDETLSLEQARRLAREVLPTVLEGRPDDWRTQTALALVGAQVYPEAKRRLIARGRAAAEVERTPVIQV